MKQHQRPPAPANIPQTSNSSSPANPNSYHHLNNLPTATLELESNLAHAHSFTMKFFAAILVATLSLASSAAAYEGGYDDGDGFLYARDSDGYLYSREARPGNTISKIAGPKCDAAKLQHGPVTADQAKQLASRCKKDCKCNKKQLDCPANIQQACLLGCSCRLA